MAVLSTAIAIHAITTLRRCKMHQRARATIRGSAVLPHPSA
jgi:hypothetical protein